MLGELDARRLYLGEGCSSLFSYCTRVLHLSEHAACHRIEAARAARRFPLILDLVADGAVTLTTVALVRPHLTLENHVELLDPARHRTKREVEHLVAALDPMPDAKPLIRRVTARTPNHTLFSHAESGATNAVLTVETATDCPARSVGARRRALCICWWAGTMRRNMSPRVPPHQAVRARRPIDRGEAGATVPRAQQLRERTGHRIGRADERLVVPGRRSATAAAYATPARANRRGALSAGWSRRRPILGGVCEAVSPASRLGCG